MGGAGGGVEVVEVLLLVVEDLFVEEDGPPLLADASLRSTIS